MILREEATLLCPNRPRPVIQAIKGNLGAMLREFPLVQLL